ncbi:hypothetical protein KFU94_05855 [Chloroflexi bacterium TSY]|nr:hypothetical protein [Chloroflexi bacterium TSY]
MSINKVRQEWQMISDDAIWDVLHPIEERVRLDATTQRSQLLPKQRLLLGSICLIILTNITIYLLWFQAKNEFKMSRVDDQMATIQIRDAQQAEVIETESRLLLVTEHFRFYSVPEDLSLVEDIGPRIEDFYRSLRQDFGLPPHREHMIVEIQKKSVVRRRYHLDNDRWTIAIPSPQLLVLPTNFSKTDAIVVFLTSALAEQMLEEIQQPAKVGWAWRQMPEVFRRWYVARHHAVLSEWHNGMVAWLTTLEQPTTAHAIPRPLRRTCRNFGQATLSIAWHGAIPVQACMATTLDDDTGLPIPHLPISLEALSSSRYDWAESTYRIKWWVRLKATETVIDYVVSQYGQEQIGSLFHGFTQYDDWEELIPAAFNIPADEFEAGWQNYVNELDDSFDALENAPAQAYMRS